MNLQKIYDNIITNSKNRIECFESLDKHRIIPGYKGGKYSKNNIALLTRKEHRIIHKIMYVLFGNWQDYQAARILGDRKYKKPWNKGISTGPLSEKTKLKMSTRLKGKSYIEVYGIESSIKMKKQRSEKFKEIRNKIEPWNKGNQCINISLSAKNRPSISEETRQKMSIAAKNRKKRS